MKRNPNIVTVCLNPAIDQTVTVASLKVGSLNRATSSRRDVGGKAINVAKALIEFQENVHAFGLLAGESGRWIERELKGWAMHTDFVFVDGETRTNLKIVDTSTGVTTEINQPGFTVSASELATLQQKLNDFLQSGDILVLSGSLPFGAPPDTYARMIMNARAAGVRTILDADGESLAEGLKARPYAVKPNLSELQELFGCKLTNDEKIVIAVRSLLNNGTQIVAVSMGTAGAIFCTAQEIWRTSYPLPIMVKSTVAAGDAMVAAIAVGMLHEMPFVEIAKFATAAGTVTATKPGSEVCTLDEVRTVAQMCRFTPFRFDFGVYYLA